jgi:integration host factor subunit alpha
VPENTLTRADIVDRLVQKVGLTKQDSSNFLERVLELVCVELERDEDVKFARFGNFVVRRKKHASVAIPRPAKRLRFLQDGWCRSSLLRFLRQRVEAAQTARRD